MTIDIVELDLLHHRHPYPIPYNSIVGGSVVLYGYAVKETSGAAGATLDLYNGTDNKGLDSIPLGIGAGQSVRDWFGPQGIHFSNGLYTVAAGAIVGALFVDLTDRGHKGER